MRKEDAEPPSRGAAEQPTSPTASNMQPVVIVRNYAKQTSATLV